MTEGTISILIGCHSPIHSLLVMRAWHRLYGHWPKPWETICIFLHDIGHIGTSYLTNEDEKLDHWWLGAVTAQYLFGDRGWALVAGHTHHSGEQESRLYRADKLSWYYAPFWWLWLNTVAEPKLCMGYTRRGAIARFREQVKASVESGVFVETHTFYLSRCKDR